MKEKELRKLYYDYFQEKMKTSEKYKNKFKEAVAYQKEHLKDFSKEEQLIIENMITKFADVEDQMLEDTFVNAVKYAYKIFCELK
ncbi:MAG: hypothetical protein ACI4VP_03240 [Clostridia bacterium]